jgi:hypothetical protein
MRVSWNGREELQNNPNNDLRVWNSTKFNCWGRDQRSWMKQMRHLNISKGFQLRDGNWNDQNVRHLREKNHMCLVFIRFRKRDTCQEGDVNTHQNSCVNKRLQLDQNYETQRMIQLVGGEQFPVSPEFCQLRF